MYAGHDRVPLGQPAGDGSVDGSRAEVGRGGDFAGDVTVEHAVLEAGEQLRGETVLHEQLVVLGLAEAVDEDVGAVAVCAEQDGVAVDLCGCEALLAVDGLEEGVCDAVGEADELEVRVGRGPVGSQGEYETAWRGIGVCTIIGEGDKGDVVSRL